MHLVNWERMSALVKMGVSDGAGSRTWLVQDRVLREQGAREGEGGGQQE